jgi:Uma2 family endonuclease
MTAGSSRPVAGFPDVRRQLAASSGVDDLRSAPDDAGRFELFDGVRRNMPAPGYDHQDIGALLWFWLRKHAPGDFRATLGTGILVEDDTLVEPDVLLVDAPVVGSSFYCTPSQVKLAVEVFETARSHSDRLTRPGLSASIGIPHYWRIEQDPIRVFAYELVGDRYEAVADSTDKLVVSAPFAIELPIRDITP